MTLPNKSDESQIALAVSCGFDRLPHGRSPQFVCTRDELLAFARSCEQVGASVAVMLREMQAMRPANLPRSPM